MRYRQTSPPPILADIVRYFWCIESDNVPAVPATHRLFAESSPGLVFFYHHNSGLVTGLADHYCEFMIGSKIGMIGAYLYPYALPLLFREEPRNLSNSNADISDFLGAAGVSLRNQIMNAENHDQRVSALAAFLINKVNAGKKITNGMLDCVQHIVNYKGTATIDSLVSAMGVSCRHFDRRFMSFVGTAPKSFSRLIRFHSSLALRKTKTSNNLTELGLTAGYYDQSHFIREFKEFSGLSPKQYFNLDDHDVADNFVKFSPTLSS